MQKMLVRCLRGTHSFCITNLRQTWQAFFTSVTRGSFLGIPLAVTPMMLSLLKKALTSQNSCTEPDQGVIRPIVELRRRDQS